MEIWPPFCLCKLRVSNTQNSVRNPDNRIQHAHAVSKSQPFPKSHKSHLPEIRADCWYACSMCDESIDRYKVYKVVSAQAVCTRCTKSRRLATLTWWSAVCRPRYLTTRRRSPSCRCNSAVLPATSWSSICPTKNYNYALVYTLVRGICLLALRRGPTAGYLGRGKWIRTNVRNDLFFKQNYMSTA